MESFWKKASVAEKICSVLGVSMAIGFLATFVVWRFFADRAQSYKFQNLMCFPPNGTSTHCDSSSLNRNCSALICSAYQYESNQANQMGYLAFSEFVFASLCGVWKGCYRTRVLENSQESRQENSQRVVEMKETRAMDRNKDFDFIALDRD